MTFNEEDMKRIKETVCEAVPKVVGFQVGHIPNKSIENRMVMNLGVVSWDKHISMASNFQRWERDGLQLCHNWNKVLPLLADMLMRFMR
jgi:hypothetical protein